MPAHTAVALRLRWLWIGSTIAVLFPSGCRVPEPPILKDKSQGIIYDTAMEADLRSGNSPALIQSSYGEYVDTLAEPVAVTRWEETSCDWEVFVGTNRGVWEDEFAGRFSLWRSRGW